MLVLTWSLVHSRSQVLWASTHRWGLSWLGHMPGWLPGSGSRLVSEVRWMSTMTKSRGRSGCGAGMGTTGPGGGSVWPPATRGARTPYRHPPYRVLGLGLLPLPQRTLFCDSLARPPQRLEHTADAPFWQCEWVFWGLSEPVHKVLAGPLPTTVGGSQALVSIGLGMEEEEGLGRGQRP